MLSISPGDARYPLLGQPLQYNPPSLLHGHVAGPQVGNVPFTVPWINHILIWKAFCMTNDKLAAFLKDTLFAMLVKMVLCGPLSTIN